MIRHLAFYEVKHEISSPQHEYISVNVLNKIHKYC